jgi:hypothetical protein
LIAFGAVATGQPHTSGIILINNLLDPVNIAALDFEEEVFTASFTGPSTIPPLGTKDICISFETEQNADYTDFLRIELDGGLRSLVVQVSAEAHHPGTYYEATQNVWAEDLKTVLTDLIDNHNSLGYTSARDHMYGSIDNDDTCAECPTTGCVECVYTGRIGCFNTRAGATANGFNCEHTWPQSFSGEMEPMKSDIFHLYPSDMTANNKRANLDFGLVTSTVWSQGGSKLGTDSTGQTVFEPRDTHKGNVARAHFYYLIRYDGSYVGYSNPTKMETHLRNWHIADPVDAAEEQRNEDIYALQNNRNPFVDHPEFVDRISSFFGTAVRETGPEIAVSPISADMGTVGFDSTAHYFVAIINTGTDTLTATDISSSNPAFTVSETALLLPPDTYYYLRVTYTSGEAEIVDSTLVLIASNDSDESLVEAALVVEVSDLAGIDDMPVGRLSLRQNFPNPFGVKTTITFHLDRPRVVDLAVYGVSGRMVRRLLTAEPMSAGEHRIAFDGGDLPSGVYFCRLSGDGLTFTRRMLLLRHD